MTQSATLASRPVPREILQLRWLLRVAVLAVGAVSIGGLVYLYRNLASYNREPEALNIVARQRMLSQRIAKNVAMIVSGAPEPNAAAELRDSMQRLGAVQAQLEQRGESLGFAIEMQDDDMEIVARARRHVDALREIGVAALALSAHAGSEPAPSPNGWDRLPPDLGRHATAFVTAVDDLITHLGDDRAAAQRRDTRLAWMLAVAIAVTLALEWLLLYEPALRLLARRTTALVQSEHQARLMHETVAFASRATDVQGIIMHCLESVCAETGWPVAHALLAGPDGLLESADLWRLPKEAHDSSRRFGKGATAIGVAAFKSMSESCCFAPGIGLPGRIYRERAPVWISDIHQDRNFPRAKPSSDVNLHAAFGFPVLVDDRVVAVLEFFHTEPMAPDAALLTLAESLGREIGIVVQRCNVQAALARSERRTRQVIDTALDARVAIDMRGTVMDWNPQAEKTFGYGRDEAVGRPLSDLIIPARLREAHLAGLARYLKSGDPKIIGQRVEVPAVRKDGSEITIELAVTAVPASPEEGGEISFSAFLHDITDRKAAEAKLAQAQKLESIGQLAAGIAHEINTPTQYVGDNVRFLKDTFGSLLGAIDAYDLALNGVAEDSPAARDVRRRLAELDLAFLRDEIPKAIDQSLEGLGQVSSIVLAMKEFSHPGSAEKTPANLNAAILSTVTVCRNRWKYVARLETDLDSNLPQVPCLVAEFNQVILNLVVNAADAIVERFGEGAADQGLIQVATRSVDASVEVSVSDNGGGIPPEIRGRIFDPFFTTKSIGKGTGQGLAISRSVIVDKHNGTIDCVSQTGLGTTFTIRLPLEESVSNGRHGASAKESGDSGSLLR